MTVNNLTAYDDFLRVCTPDRLQKILARNELFQLSMDLPGDIVECGVFKGSGIYTWAKLIQIFKPSSLTRVIGFDFFGENRDTSLKHDQDQSCLDMHKDGWASPESLRATCASWGFDRLDFVAGDVTQTTKEFAKNSLGARISLLYIDIDNYEGTLEILRNLYPLVVPGGIVAFDEYAIKGFGEADAVDEYFQGKNVRLKSLPWARTPSAYMIKA